MTVVFDPTASVTYRALIDLGANLFPQVFWNEVYVFDELPDDMPPAQVRATLLAKTCARLSIPAEKAQEIYLYQLDTGADLHDRGLSGAAAHRWLEIPDRVHGMSTDYLLPGEVLALFDDAPTRACFEAMHEELIAERVKQRIPYRALVRYSSEVPGAGLWLVPIAAEWVNSWADADAVALYLPRMLGDERGISPAHVHVLEVQRMDGVRSDCASPASAWRGIGYLWQHAAFDGCTHFAGMSVGRTDYSLSPQELHRHLQQVEGEVQAAHLALGGV